MSACPDIEALQSLAASGGTDEAGLLEHLVGCPACQGVLALFAGHEEPPPGSSECADAELSLAALESGELSPEAKSSLEAHLAACEGCRQLAEGTGFESD